MFSKRSGSVLFVLAGMALILSNGCKKENGSGCGITNISSHGQTNSHNSGQNCMGCHSDGGGGKGCFTVAVSVYSEPGTALRPNGQVRLYTGANGTGTLRGTVDVDAKGNFHTTAAIDFSGGLYPVVTNAAGDVEHMSDAIGSGACNSCHGQSTGILWVP